MLLRISEERLKDSTVIHVAGRLEGDGVDELGRACRGLSGPIRLELSALLQADEVGLALLRSLRDAGVKLSGASPFIDLLLDSGREHAAN